LRCAAFGPGQGGASSSEARVYLGATTRTIGL
jgi:hypothetical protein